MLSFDRVRVHAHAKAEDAAFVQSLGLHTDLSLSSLHYVLDDNEAKTITVVILLSSSQNFAETSENFSKLLLLDTGS